MGAFEASYNHNEGGTPSAVGSRRRNIFTVRARWPGRLSRVGRPLTYRFEIKISEARHREKRRTGRAARGLVPQGVPQALRFSMNARRLLPCPIGGDLLRHVWPSWPARAGHVGLPREVLTISALFVTFWNNQKGFIFFCFFCSGCYCVVFMQQQ